MLLTLKIFTRPEQDDIGFGEERREWTDLLLRHLQRVRGVPQPSLPGGCYPYHRFLKACELLVSPASYS